ncbi:LexA family protein [Ruminococcus albus]|uniref:LexA family protein n=1 Tax=Ruminococcus albus TaxID=1264 RepID=UPI000941E4E4|nr:S24 family peptidase [Ruminococcus albus]
MRSKDKELMIKIRSYIDEYALENLGRSPSTREIGEEFNMSNVTAFRYLKAMSEQGILKYEDGEIHTELIDKFNTDMNVVGALSASVPAGSPDMVDDVLVDEYFPLPSALLHGLSGKFYMMPVCGESMVDAGIDDGDHVIFQEDNATREGDIVVAYIEGEGNTLKRYCKDEKGPFLWAENESWTNERRMFGRHFEVRGIAVKVMKDL